MTPGYLMKRVASIFLGGKNARPGAPIVARAFSSFRSGAAPIDHADALIISAQWYYLWLVFSSFGRRCGRGSGALIVRLRTRRHNPAHDVLADHQPTNLIQCAAKIRTAPGPLTELSLTRDQK
jgi:hypothetical protein